MIQYTTTDVLQRAMQLADLENSQFITYTEKLALLNEVYTALYQKLINKGDGSFTITSTIQGGTNVAYTVPEDFWQVKSIVRVSNGYSQAIPRKSANMDEHDFSYELSGNTLTFYGDSFDGQVKITYWPKPVTLTFPNVVKKLTYSQNNIQYYGPGFVITGGPTPAFIMDTGASTQLTGIGNTILSASPELVISNTTIVNPSTNETFPTHIIPVLSLTTGDVGVYDTTTQVVTITGQDISIQAPTITNTDTLRYLLIDDQHAVFYTLKTVYIDGVDQGITPAHFVQQLFANATGIYMYSAGVIIKLVTPTGTVVNIYDVDNNTGYGYVTTSPLQTKPLLQSFMPDTKLNFPNSFYFSVLAYDLAIAFKAKQGGDLSALQLLKDQREQVFYDTLGDDAWNPIRITNMY